MFRLFAEKNKLALLEREPVTSGSVNVYGAQFEFSEDWTGLDRTAVFEAAGVSREVRLYPGGACVVPWEVLRVPGVRLRAGVYGKQGGEVVLPTVWADLGVILEGVPAGESPPPSPDVWEQALAGMQAEEVPQPRQIQTDFYRNSLRMGKDFEKDGGYWESNTEMTARAFACYVMDKLPGDSDYLVGHAESAVTFVAGRDGEPEILKAFPEGEERKAINAVFDEIVAELKREQILTHSNETLPLGAQALAENGQLSLFPRERPSVVGRVAAIKEAGKAAPLMAVPKKKP